MLRAHMDSRPRKRDPIRVVVYTAGPMTTEGEWRSLVEARIREIEKDEAPPWTVEFLHPGNLDPRAFGCDHGGIMPDLVVNEDLNHIDDAHLVLAYLPRRDLYGTHVEIGYAVAREVNVLIFDSTPFAMWDEKHSGHRCSCSTDGAPYWFARHAAAHRWPYGAVYTAARRRRCKREVRAARDADAMAEMLSAELWKRTANGSVPRHSFNEAACAKD